MKEDRRVSLLYNSPSRGKTLVLQGMAVEVEDPRLKAYYWRSKWAQLADQEDVVLVKVFVESMEVRRDGSGDEMRLEKTRGVEGESSWYVV
jgi:hypothetical protein